MKRGAKSEPQWFETAAKRIRSEAKLWGERAV